MQHCPHHTRRFDANGEPITHRQAVDRVAWRSRVGAGAAFALAWLFSASATAGTADVVAAVASCDGPVCSFRVTVEHADEGWDHYANAWAVLAPDGTVLATRVLRHPHVNEQPFTRELRRVEIPLAITSVRVRARDSHHGFGGRELDVALDRSGAVAVD